MGRKVPFAGSPKMMAVGKYTDGGSGEGMDTHLVGENLGLMPQASLADSW